jgi:hypothetical protein
MIFSFQISMDLFHVPIVTAERGNSLAPSLKRVLSKVEGGIFWQEDSFV